MNNDFAYNLPYTSSKWLNDTYNPMYDAIFQPIKGGNFLNGAKYTQNCLAVQQEPFSNFSCMFLNPNNFSNLNYNSIRYEKPPGTS